MSNIEERVTKLVFDTAQFGSKMDAVLKQLAQLTQSLKLDGAQKGLQDVSDTANKFSLDGMKNQVSGVLGQFNALQVAAITALSNIVNRAVEAGIQITKSLTIDPIMSGFREYETNLNSIQTILANTGLEGAAGLAKVTSKLNELNEYSDQTIYNFSEMARNIGTFTAAGVDLDKSTAAIKGIANLAAISGSNSQQASTAMYQLSQALSAGKVSLEDWNSVVNAGMGGKIFRDSLIETARVHGVKIDEIIKKQGSFRNSIQEGWITTDILAETLSKFTGDLSEEQLKSLGYTKEQIEGIQKMGKTATDAATKVKTMTQLLDTLRESAGSGWAKTWQIIFGDFEEARGMFTEVSNVLGGAINQMSDARNKLLQGWKDLGGRDALIDGIANAFQALLSVLRPIGQAFREMFPATTAKQLYDLTVTFRDFMERLKIGGETANNLRRTFAGFFAILGIGWDLVKAGANFIGELIGKFTGGAGSILRFTGNIGDFLVALRKFLQEGKVFQKFFEILSTIIDGILKIVSNFARVFGQIWDKVDIAPAEEMLHKVANAAKPVASAGDLIRAAWEGIGRFFGNIAELAYAGLNKVWNILQKVREAIGQVFGGSDGQVSNDSLFKGINTAALVAFVTMLWNFFRNFKPGEFLEAIVESIEALTGALRGMQHALNAAALLGIALSIGILAVSMEKLSKIDSMGLTRASVAIAVLMSEMAAAFLLFDKVGGTLGAAKLIIVSTALIRLGAALLILVTAVEKLAKLNWEELAKGLTGVLVLTGALVAGVKFLPTDIAGIVKTATGLLVLTIAIRSLTNAVEDLSRLSWEQLAKGLVGVAVLLGSLALFTKFAQVDKGGIAAGIGLVLIATSLEILADAVGQFIKYNWEQLARGMAGIGAGIAIIAGALYLLPPTSVFSAAGVLIVAASLNLIGDAVAEMSKLSWGEIGRGLTVMAGALLAIALAIGFLPPTSLFSAVGVFIVAASLGMIQEALGKMSKMTWEEIGKGLVVLAGALLIIAGALFLMQNAVPGAIAVLVVAAALRVLTPVLEALGAMSWEAIAKGLVALAGVFVILGAAGIILGPVAGVIVGLAASIALLGIAVLAAGVGVLAFATGLGILAAVGAGATAALVGIVTAMLALLPQVGEQLGLAVISFAKILAEAGTQITEAMTKILISVIDAIIAVIPKIIELLYVLLTAMIKFIESYVPTMVDSGARIIISFLEGMNKHVDKIVTVATDLLVSFIEAIGRNLHRVHTAGVQMIIDTVNGVAQGIRDNSAKMGEAGVNLATAMVEGVIRGIGAGIGRAVSSAVNLAKEMFNAAKRELGINSPSKKFEWLMEMSVDGIEVGGRKNADRAGEAAAAVGENMIDSMAKTLTGLGKVLGSDLIDFDPTITPVLDLSLVKANAAELVKMLDIPNLDVSGTYTKAQTTKHSVDESRSDDSSADGSNAGDQYTFTQYNTSPKALSNAELYRQTDNLISRARKKVSNNA
jgi:tape measure domain-containing protein